MTGAFTESVVEEAAFAWLDSLGYAVLNGPAIAAGMPGAKRNDMLLPKLISGETRVTDAERVVKEAE